MPLMVRRPQIAPEARMDDYWAGRMVDQMLLALVDDAKKAWDHAASIMKGVDAYKGMGNPAGQRKIAARISEATKLNRIGAVGLDSGTRHRCYLEYSLWLPGTMAGSGDRTPTVLSARTYFYHGTGPNRPPLVSYGNVVTFSRHALVRLVQRANCACAEDLVAILSTAYPMFRLAYGASDTGVHMPPYDSSKGWLVPICNLTGDDVIVATLNQMRTDSDWKEPFVKTILDRDWVDHDILVPLAEAVTKMVQGARPKNTEMLPLFQATPDARLKW